ncbi:hypothetical protein [Marinobacter salarius]|uniref:hypothetical protein n=1 Tax=Marinobacter salarius TaxID=1420917 RepID=UPI0032EC20DD
MKLYSFDVNICGTVYVKANTLEEAAKQVRNLQGHSIEIEGEMIDSRPFDQVEEEITLSPMMTIGKQASSLFEIVHDYEETT